MSVCIIADGGTNHKGDLNIAKRMIDEASKAGADYFSIYLEQTQSLVVNYNACTELKQYCKNAGIGFLVSAPDVDSIDSFENLDMDFWKVPLDKIKESSYLVKLGRTGRPVMLSTDMKNVEAIRNALLLLVGNGCSNITLLESHTSFPTKYKEINLSTMGKMRDEFDVETGLSDRTQGVEISLAAVALGATVIEKPFTLDKKDEGPFHRYSLDVEEFAYMVKAIRHIEETK